jgi:hypothetical protein
MYSGNNVKKEKERNPKPNAGVEILRFLLELRETAKGAVMVGRCLKG